MTHIQKKVDIPWVLYIARRWMEIPPYQVVTLFISSEPVNTSSKMTANLNVYVL